MWSIGRYDLHLSDEEFYRLTPRQFYALLDRHTEEHKFQELLMGIETASIVNHSFCRPEKPHTPSIYMPSMREETPKPKHVSLKKQFVALRGALAPYRK